MPKKTAPRDRRQGTVGPAEGPSSYATRPADQANLTAMSKAFVRESDGQDADEPPRRASALPPGTVNYMTPAGAQRLRDEFRTLRENERPAALARVDPADPESKRDLQVLDRRLQELEASLRALQVVSPPPGPPETARFGSSVTVREPSGAESTFRIVGVDEAEPARNWISWLSPAARTLINCRVGDRRTLRRPGGTLEWEIVRIAAE
jgi:transcription elongation factor GreB